MPTTAGVFFGRLDETAKEEVLKAVAEQAKDRFRTYREAVKQSTGLRTPRAQERLDAYRERIPEVWARLQKQFPQEYERQQNDWRNIEKNNQRRLQEIIGDMSGKEFSKSINRGLPAVNKAAASVSPAPRMPY